MKKLLSKLFPPSFYQKLSDAYYRLLHILYSLFPIVPNKVFIVSYYGADFGDNGKSVALELLRRGGYDIVWALKPELMGRHHLPEGVRAVAYHTPAAVREMQTAAVWIDNCRKSQGFKRKGQLYIQTWHGGPGVKKCEGDSESALNPRYAAMARRDSRMIDVLLSNSDFMDALFRRAFWYEHEILRTGTPRNDLIVAGEHRIRESVRAQYGVAPEKKIALYAPTFRASRTLDLYNLDIPAVLSALRERFSGEWVLFARLHPNISGLSGAFQLDGGAVNVTLHPDMQELLCAADCLITDYSSCAADFLLSGKPCFLYLPDYDAYNEERGYYFTQAEQPYPYAFTNPQMLQNIRSFDEAQYAKRREAFFSLTGLAENGNASSQVADLIARHMSSLQ